MHRDGILIRKGELEARARRLEGAMIKFRTLAYGCAPLARLKEVDDEYEALILGAIENPPPGKWMPDGSYRAADGTCVPLPPEERAKVERGKNPPSLGTEG